MGAEIDKVFSIFVCSILSSGEVGLFFRACL